MANKGLATRQKMRLTVKVVPTVRTPVAVAAKLREAGPHAKGPAQERAAAKRALKKAKLVPDDD